MSSIAPKHSARRTAGTLKWLTASVDRLVCKACVALFMAILVTMVLQVFFRYVLSAPLTWTEELARYMYIWACWLGAPVALRRGNHIVIVVVAERLPQRIAQVTTLIIHVVSLFFLTELAIQGIRLAIRAHTVEAITLPIPWSMIYIAAPISGFLMILITAEAVWANLVPIAQEVKP